MKQSYQLKSGRSKSSGRLLPKLVEVLGIVVHPIGFSGVGHLLKHGRELLGIEQVIDREMGVRSIILISVGQTGGTLWERELVKEPGHIADTRLVLHISPLHGTPEACFIKRSL